MNRRVPPSSPRSESGVIGVLLVRPDVLADVVDTGLRPEDFYRPAWATAYSALLALAGRGEPIDAVTLDEALAGVETRPTADDLLRAMSDVPSLGHAQTYAARIIDTARLRRVIGACAEIIEAAYGAEARSDVDSSCDAFEAQLHTAIDHEDPGSGPAALGGILDDGIAELRRRSSGERIGLPTGFVDLDRMTGGLRPGQLIVLGARPAMGKSALALDIALHAARTSGPVLFVSAEMGALELGTRVLAGGGVASDRLLAARLDDLDWSRLETRRAELAGVPLLIDDAPGTTLLAIRGRARRQAARGGLALLVVDYLQLIGADRRGTRREAEVAEISRGLKALARELHVPVVAVAQLNRAVELRADKRPMLSDLRESGQLEQDADLVLLLHRAAVYDLDADPGAAELIVAKHRNGPTGVDKLTWLAQRMSFANAAPAGVDF
ncbi:MAG: replicative DNA helicase [Acidimicrobiales bacterium]